MDNLWKSVFEDIYRVRNRDRKKTSVSEVRPYVPIHPSIKKKKIIGTYTR